MTMPLVLASGSAVRQRLLKEAGIDFEAHPADLDEAEIAAEMLRNISTHVAVAQKLADAKALSISAEFPGRTVLGSDQVLSFDGRLLMKCVDGGEARERLKMLRGKTHDLAGAMTLARDDEILWRHKGVCRMTMRDFSDGFLDSYLERGLPDILSSVGAYFFEGEGAQLFSKVEGDYFSCLGLI